MTDENRREFMKKLAKSVAYVAPTIVSVTAPASLAGQGGSSQHKHQDPLQGHGHAAAGQGPGGPPPWRAPPPGTPRP